MGNHLVIFLTSFGIAFSGALMPGPLLSGTISESIRRGPLTGPLFILGHGILELILITALFLGLAPIIVQEEVFTFIALAGGGFMIFMAAGMLKGLPCLSLQADETIPLKGNLIFLGAALSLANPYWLIWWATIGLGYILSAGKFGLSGVIIFFAGHILADALWYVFVSAAVSKTRSIMSDKVYRILIGICAIFLLSYALYLISTVFL
ncbi:MAG: LysE family transporter [Spirochaetales bacterium]|nr:LysE family transporter [Spirochaetales bacterium]